MYVLLGVSPRKAVMHTVLLLMEVLQNGRCYQDTEFYTAPRSTCLEFEYFDIIVDVT